MSAARELPEFDRPMNEAERRWARTVDPLVARLAREYPELFPTLGDTDPQPISRTGGPIRDTRVIAQPHPVRTGTVSPDSVGERAQALQARGRRSHSATPAASLATSVVPVERGDSI